MDKHAKKGFLADLFTGSNNAHWELSRIMGFLAFLPMVAAVVFNIWVGITIKQFIDLMALGGGIAAIYTAVAILIAAKQYVRTNDDTKKAEQTAAIKLAENGGTPPTIVEGDLQAENIENVEVKK